MPRIIGKAHLYSGCYQTFLGQKIEMGKLERKLSMLERDYVAFVGICPSCAERAEQESLAIDDFNSVWFGLGPDMQLALV